MSRSPRSPKSLPGPSGPHPFVEPKDARSGLALGAMQGGLQMAAPMALADASLQSARCALPGCDKARQDPIHWPAD